MKNNKPQHFLIFKILGIVFAVVALAGFGLTITGFGDFESNNFMIGGLMSTFGLVLAIFFLFNGFKPEIAKLRTKSAKYIQEENKQDLTELASNTAEISSDAITKTTRAIKSGLKNTKFCKHCGAEIDADSKFCNSCGGEQ